MRTTTTSVVRLCLALWPALCVLIATASLLPAQVQAPKAGKWYEDSVDLGFKIKTPAEWGLRDDLEVLLLRPYFALIAGALAAGLLAAAGQVRDPLWRMPLWAGYRGALDAEIADLRNDPAGWAQAGSVTAALFLQKFAPATGAWAHMDIFAWNPRARPGYPEGGEAQALRACYAMLKARYAT